MGVHNNGQRFQCIPFASGESSAYVGTPDADIDAPEAWKLSAGNSNVMVAVIDTEIDYNHPDLAANYLGGYDFVFNDVDSLDDHGHGTLAAPPSFTGTSNSLSRRRQTAVCSAR